MSIAVGNTLPDATLIVMTDEGPSPVSLSDKSAGRKVVLFALPGAYTGVCTEAHMPSFVRTAEAFAAKGVDEIICVSVNDPFVLATWAEATGAGGAGIAVLGDPDSSFTEAMGMRFDAPPVGLIGRSKRYALYAENGVVKVLNAEDNPGQCEISAGETLLAAI